MIMNNHIDDTPSPGCKKDEQQKQRKKEIMCIYIYIYTRNKQLENTHKHTHTQTTQAHGMEVITPLKSATSRPSPQIGPWGGARLRS